MFDVEGYADPSTISTELLDRVKDSSCDGWRRLVRVYGPLVYRWCREFSLQPSDASDITQEVFCAVVTHIGEFRRDREEDTFRGWLRTITRNKVRDLIRRRERTPHPIGAADIDQLTAEADDFDDSQLQLENELRGLVSRALSVIQGDFDPRTWQAFIETAVLEQQAPVVAEKLGMNAHAVRQAKHRVMKRLRRELEPFDS